MWLILGRSWIGGTMADGQENQLSVSRGRRPKGHGPDLPAAILNAAEDLVSRHGFYGVTVRQVAAEAGVDTALVHYYFGAKRELSTRSSPAGRSPNQAGWGHGRLLSAHADRHRGGGRDRPSSAPCSSGR